MATPLLLIQPVGHNPDAMVDVVHSLPAGYAPKLLNTTGLGFDDAVRAYEKFLDKNEIRSVMVAGHNTGAAIAVRLAHRNPTRVTKLLLSSPVLFLDEKQTQAQITALKFLPNFLLKGAKNDMRAAFESNLGLDVRAEAEELTSKIIVVDALTDPAVWG